MTDTFAKAREAACNELRDNGLGLFAAEKALDAALSAFSAHGYELCRKADIRNEALEEAAYQCEDWIQSGPPMSGCARVIASEIRALKHKDGQP